MLDHLHLSRHLSGDHQKQYTRYSKVPRYTWYKTTKEDTQTHGMLSYTAAKVIKTQSELKNAVKMCLHSNKLCFQMTNVCRVCYVNIHWGNFKRRFIKETTFQSYNISEDSIVARCIICILVSTVRFLSRKHNILHNSTA